MSKLGMFQGPTGVGSPVNVRLLSSVGDGVARAGAQMGSAINSLLDTGMRIGGQFAKEKVEEDQLQDGITADRGITIAKAGMQGLRDRWNSDDFAGGSRETQADTDNFYSNLERGEFRTERESRLYDSTIQNMRIMSMAEAKSIGEAVTARRYKESARRAVDEASRAGEYDSAIMRIQADESVAWSPEEADELRGVVHDQQGWDVFNRTSKEDPWKGAAMIGELATQGHLSKKTLAKMASFAEKNIKAAQSGLADALATKQLLGEDVVEDVKGALKRGHINPTKARVLLGAAARGAAGEEVHDGAVYSGLTSAVGSLFDDGLESDSDGSKAAKLEFAINTAPISKGSKSVLMGRLSAFRSGNNDLEGDAGQAAKRCGDIMLEGGTFGTVKDEDGRWTVNGFVSATSKRLAAEKELARLLRLQKVPVEQLPDLMKRAARTVNKEKFVSPEGGALKSLPVAAPSRGAIRGEDASKVLSPNVPKGMNNVDKKDIKLQDGSVDLSFLKIDGEDVDGFVGRYWGEYDVDSIGAAALARAELINLYYA